jgi:hypothetical protein
MRMSRLRLLAGTDGPRVDDHRADYSAGETVLVLVAGLAVVGGLIHVGAAVDHYGEFPLYTLVFATLAGAQISWAALVLRRPSARLLVFGCALNLAIVGLWVASRTVGVPIAPQAWVPESVGVADVVEMLGELTLVFAVASVMLSSRSRLARRTLEHLAPLLLLVLTVSALFGVGAHAS